MVNNLSGGKDSSYMPPDINLPEKKKGEDFHKQFIYWIVNQNLNKGWANRFNILQNCYDFYDNAQSGDQFRFITEALDSTALPAVWQTLPRIRNKVNLLVGEFLQRGYDFKVEAINKEARSRKLEAKEQMRVDMRLQEYAAEIEEQTGMPLTDETLPQDEEELDEFFDKNYKETSEIVMYYSLKYLDKKWTWGKTRQELFLDELIAGMCFAKTEICNGLPKARRIDPRNFIYDPNCESDLLTDSTYFGEIRWMPLGEAAEKYNLTLEELKNCRNSYEDFLKWKGRNSGQRNQFETIGFDSLRQDSGLQWFKETEGGLRVLVFEAYWQDYKVIKYKSSEDKHGYEQFNRVSDAAQDREGVTSKRAKVWRKGTLIGGQFLKDWGLMENQARDNEKLLDVDPPYFGLIPFFVSGRAVSMVDQLKGLQNLKDIVFYNIQLAMSRMGGKGFVYDVSQCPPDWNVAEVMKYLKTTNIAFIDSKSGGTPSQYNQFQNIDLTAEFTPLIDLAVMIDREMDSISGVNEARQGVIQGASQGATVTQSALLQSSLVTEPYFKFFNYFASNVWGNMARLVKIAWAGKERFAPIIGDAGVDFLKEDIDLSLDDYGVFVEETPRLIDDISSFQQIVMAGLQSGGIRFDDAMKLMMEKDVVSGVRRLEKIMNKREEEQFERDRQLQQEQAQMAEQSQVKMQQYNMDQSRQASEKQLQVQQLKNQGAIDNTVAAGRIKLSDTQLKAIADMLAASQEPKPTTK